MWETEKEQRHFESSAKRLLLQDLQRALEPHSKVTYVQCTQLYFALPVFMYI